MPRNTGHQGQTLCHLGSMSGELAWSINDETVELKFTEIDKGLKIDKIIIPASCRNKGIGTHLLQHFIQLASIYNKDIYVIARPLGGRTNPERLNRLVRFYQQLGFKKLEEGISICHMVRYHSHDPHKNRK